MTTRLAQALSDAAEQAPRVPLPEDLWRRGRRSRRRRRAGAALALLLLAAGLAWLPVRGQSEPYLAGAGPDVLPAAVAEPHLWQQTFAGSPNGPLKMVFTTGHSLNFESALVLIGQDDSYRLDYLAPGEEPGSLSPDGRMLLRHGVLDLTTGRTRELAEPIASTPPAAWAPDSRTALGVLASEGGTAYDDNGQPIDGPPDQLALVDVTTGTVRSVVAIDPGSGWGAAFSPDGSRVAIYTTSEDVPDAVRIMDVRSERVERTVDLSDRQKLAGPAAWSPDGSQILLAAGDGCTWAEYCPDQTWHVQRLDVATGAITDETTSDRAGMPSLVAWRDGNPIFQLERDPAAPCEMVALTTAGPQILPLTVAGHGCADYARDLLEQGTLGGPAIGPSFWQAQWWAYAFLSALLAALIQLAWRLTRHFRRRVPATPE